MKFKLILTCEYELDSEIYSSEEMIKWNRYIKDDPFDLLEKEDYTVEIEEI